MTEKRSLRSIFAAIIFSGLFLLLASCGGGGGDSGGTAGSTGTIEVTTSATNLPADGTSSLIITATIRDSAGNPVRHYTDVTFTTTLGHFRNGSATYTMQTQPPLDEKGWPNPDGAPTGIVQVTFTAGTMPGVATVTVHSNGVTQTAYITIKGSSASITLTAAPGSIQADGQSSTIITATLTDTTGAPVKAGTAVNFRTGLGSFTGGGLTSESDRDTHLVVGSKSYTVVTPDATGVVRVSLIAGLVPGTTFVVASSNNISQSLEISLVNVSLSEMTALANPPVILADGKSTSLVTATIKDANDRPIEGAPVTFIGGSFTTGPALPEDNTWEGTGENLNVTPGFYTSTAATFIMTHFGNNDWNFSVELWNSDTMTMVSTLINTTGPVTGQARSVTLGAGNYFLRVRAESEATWRIQIQGSLSPTQEGERELLAILRTDANGNASYTYTSTTTPMAVPINLLSGEPTTSENTEALKDSVQIKQVEEISTVTVTPGDSSIIANGEKQTTINALILNEQGGLAPDGTVVTFSTTAGTLGKTTDQTEDGRVSTTLTASSSPTTVRATVTISVTYGAKVYSGSSEVEFLGVNLTDMKATPATIFADGKDTSEISVRIRDAKGLAVVDESVTFSSTLGSLQIQEVATDRDGVAKTTLIAPTTTGVATITAVYGLITATTQVVFTEYPTVGSMELTASPTTIPADGSSTSTITATLKDSAGAAVLKGTTVEFITDLGTFSNGQQSINAITPDDNGVVSVSLRASNTPGSAKVIAMSGGVRQAVYVGMGGAPISISLAADPETIPADGKSSSTITATLKDASGKAVTPGTSVTFDTTLGTFSNGAASMTVTTQDDTGIVSVSLIASTTAGSAKVTASASGVSQSIYVGMGGSAITIALAADPTSIPADGKSSSTITATLKDGAGKAVTPGTSVRFDTTLGTFSNGTATITVATQDNTGIVSVSLKSSTTTGTATVTATSNNVSQSVTVDFTGTVVSTITLTATPNTLPADGKSTSVIRAEVKDASGNPIADGQEISFTITSGTGELSAESGTTSGGFATVTYTAGDTVGTVMIRAMAANGVTGSTTINLTGGNVGSITLVANPASILADGASSSAITATLKDLTGNPVVKGTLVVFSTNLGTLSSTTVTTPDATGIVTVSLISGTDPGTATVTATSGGISQTVDVGFTGSPDVGSVEVSANPTSILADGASTSAVTALVKTANNQVVEGASVSFTTTRGSITSPHTSDANGKAVATLTSERYVDASVTVTARCQGVEDSIIVAFTGISLTLEADPKSVIAGGSSTITATLKDAANNPIPNTNVTFSTDKGTLTPPAPQPTNASGQVTVTLTSNTSGTATVTATALGAEGKVEVNFTRYSFSLAANPTTIRVGGETSALTATLLDEGVPKAAQTIYFSTTLGTLNPYQQNTAADGTAVTTLTSGTQAGNAVIDASTTITDVTPNVDLAASASVVIIGGAAAKIVLTASPDVIDISTGVSTITANVYDANDQPAGDQQVYFRINAGPGGGEYLSASVKTTNTSGVATVSFYAGSLTSTLKGVIIEANTESDFSGSYGLAYLTIAGPVANIGIGMNLETLTPDGGSLKIDIAGIATDVNGNPVADGSKIYFAVTAVEFDEDRANDRTIDCWDDSKNPLIPCPAKGTPGFGFTWFSDDVNQDGTMYSLGGPMCTTEDVNHNGILDPGEDKNDNGVIDPIQGCTIDSPVETTSGVAKATLIYPAPQANNIRVRITAEAGGVSNFYETILLCTQTMVDNGTCGIAY